MAGTQGEGAKGVYVSLAVLSEIVATKVKPEGRGGQGRRQGHEKDTQSTQAEQKIPEHTQHTYVCAPEVSYLLVGVRSVKAQEEVGGFAVEEEVSSPEWDGEAMDSAAEVKGDPQVLGISIYKDVLQERTGKVRATARQSHPTGP